MKYGRLQIIEYLPKGRVLCECECGTKDFVTNKWNVKNGLTTSCGCYSSEIGRFNMKILTARRRRERYQRNKGKKFGRLTLLKEMPFSGLFRQKNGRVESHVFALFECECGREKVMRSFYVTAGYIKSCGCMKGPRKKREIRGYRKFLVGHKF